jgi:putative transposase
MYVPTGLKSTVTAVSVASTVESASGLTRAVTFQFTLDPTKDQRALFTQCAGARRKAYNYHIGRVKENLYVRSSEKQYCGAALTGSLSWSGFSLINDFNAWKNGELEDSPKNDDGTRGLSWRSEVPADVFECASADAAQALKNWNDSRKKVRAGAVVGFPQFTSKNKSTPSFRLRNRAPVEGTQLIRFRDRSHLRLPKIGAVKIYAPTRQVRSMLDSGRFHIYSATLTHKGGKWLVSLTGVAAPLNRALRNPLVKHHSPVGVDLGLNSLAVAADSRGGHLVTFEGVKELRIAEDRLIKAQKHLARTTPGSKGHAKAKAVLNKRHRKVALIRRHLLHQVSSWLVRTCQTVVLEDLNVSGMLQNHSLAKSVADASFSELRRQVTYKAEWYKVELIIADRFFASSKTCSGCGQVKETLLLGVRTYVCEHCGLVIDRDLNAAINLAQLGLTDVDKELAELLSAEQILVT